MRCLVTGATSRQANPDASDVGKKEIAFAWLLAEALRSMGHDVEHRNPSVVEDLSGFDHVFVGLAPLHGLGSNRAYGVLSAVLRTWDTGKLSLFVDDPDVSKVTGGLRTMAHEPQRLVKPFFAYKLEYEVASKPEYADWLQAGVHLLNDQQWPRLIVPAHPWFVGMDAIVKRVPQALGRTTTLDLSAYLPEVKLRETDDERLEQWVCEARADDKWLRQQQPGAPVYRIGKDGNKAKLPDTHLVNLYTRSIGVLRPPIEPVGWWSSRIGYARQVRAPYVTRWQDVQSLGDSYTVLPHTITAMDREGRATLADAQAAAFDNAIPTQQLCQSYINEILNPTLTPTLAEETSHA
jgi:hypothetical protein